MCLVQTTNPTYISAQSTFLTVTIAMWLWLLHYFSTGEGLEWKKGDKEGKGTDFLWRRLGTLFVFWSFYGGEGLYLWNVEAPKQSIEPRPQQ